MKLQSIAAFATLALVSVPAIAGPSQLPEPGVLALIGIGAVAGVAVAVRKRRKK
jgi:hypothetical protein